MPLTSLIISRATIRPRTVLQLSVQLLFCIGISSSFPSAFAILIFCRCGSKALWLKAAPLFAALECRGFTLSGRVSFAPTSSLHSLFIPLLVPHVLIFYYGVPIVIFHVTGACSEGAIHALTF